jgi:clan AA aspartic protease (TIGR02281 family)
MKMKRSNFTRLGAGSFTILSFLFFLSLLFPLELRSEFYGYVDKEGNRHFVDSVDKIPPEYRDSTKAYKERYDDLPEKQRSIMLEKDRIELEKRREEDKRKYEEWQRTQKAWEQELKKQEIMRELEWELKQKKRERERTETRLKRKGVQKVIIVGNPVVGNAVLVPVTLGYRGKVIETRLMLDTGASMIALHLEIAKALNIDLRRFKRVRPRVAGGKSITAYVGQLDYVQAGPIKKEDILVSVIEHQGPPVPFKGLLGMNFLQGLEYHIDFENQVINWNP